MDDEEKEYYTKLSTFTFEISLDVLHHYFEIKILDKEEFFSFLDRCKHVLFHACHPNVHCCECRNESIPLSKNSLNHDQFNLLFDIENSTLQCLHNKTFQNCLCKYSASRSVKVDSLDISLVYAIIKTCCPSIHGKPEWIKDVKNTRNFLAHKNNYRLTKDEYDSWLTTVENATLDLAKVVSSTFLTMIKKQISVLKKEVVSSNADVCKRLESKMIQGSKSLSRDIQNVADHVTKCTDMISINFSELVFKVKTQICEQLPSQNITEESAETGCGASTPQTAQLQRTQSKNENKCIVEWKLATPDTWNVSEIKDTLQHFSCLLKQWFEIEFVYIGSLVIRTIVPEHILSNYDDFKSAVRSFLAKIVEVCQLDTDTPTVVKVDLNIFTEIPPRQVKAYESKLQQQQTQLENTSKQFDEAKQECSRLSSENEQLHNSQMSCDKLREDITECERQMSEKEEQVKGYETKLQQQKTQLKNASEKLEEAKQECMRLFTENEELQNLQRTNEEQNEKISEYERQILENGEQVKAYKSKLQQQQTQLEDTTEQFDEAKQECSRFSSENEKLLHYEELYLTVEQERQHQEDTINQVTEQLRNSQMSCDKLREDITECERQMSEKEDQLRDYESNYQHMKNQQENYQMELEQSKLQCTQLTSELARRNENDENNAYLHAMIVKSDKEKEMALAEITELNSTIEAANEEMAKLKEELQNREERMYELTQAMETERKSNEEYKGQQEATMAMMQTETEKYLITIRTNESNIEHQRTETVGLYSQIQQLQGKLQGINLDLQKRDGELKITLLARDQAKQNVLQHVEIINRLNTQLQSKEQEIQHIQDEINRTRVEGRELQLKYREMAEKEARFNCIVHKNRTLLEENRELQERIKSLDPLQIQINFVRDENARLSWECQRYQDRCGYTDQKFRDLVTQLQQLTEENQMIRSNRIQLNRQLHQKVDEVETLKRQLQDVVCMSQEPPQQSQLDNLVEDLTWKI